MDFQFNLVVMTTMQVNRDNCLEAFVSVHEQEKQVGGGGRGGRIGRLGSGLVGGCATTPTTITSLPCLRDTTTITKIL